MAKKKKRRIRKKRVTLLVIICFLLVIGGFLLFNKSNNTKKEEQSNSSSNVEVEEPVEPEPEVIPDRRMSLVMVGDCLIHGAVYQDAYKNGKYDFSSMFTYIADIIKDYDLRYYNQETIISGMKPSGYPRFSSPDAIGNNLVDIGFNLVSLANNHTLDKGEKAITYSNKFWKSKEGVVVAGTYDSKEERDDVPVYEKNGIKYSFLSYTTHTNGLKSSKGHEYMVNRYSKDTVKKDVELARSKGAEVVLVAMHWGSEYTHTPTKEEKDIAKYLSELGVNVIIGCHPHVIQPIAYVGDTLVFYSLGNFISNQESLGIAKIIGLLASVDIVVDEDSNVRFENLDYQLHYTSASKSRTGFKVIPFSKLDDKTLKNHDSIEKKYLKIVKGE